MKSKKRTIVLKQSYSAVDGTEGYEIVELRNFLRKLTIGDMLKRKEVDELIGERNLEVKIK